MNFKPGLILSRTNSRFPNATYCMAASFALLVLAFLLATPSDLRAQEIDLANRADVLIVTSADLAEAWKPFADWKTRTGRPARIVTTKSIESDYEGDDIQQKIRACCLEHINKNQTRWVVLGGDSSGDAGLVPDRDTDHSKCRQLPYDNIPTDIYYISVSDWDANGDGIYGSYADDMDAVTYTHPKASIGRIPVRTSADVRAYTAKVIAYESNHPTDDFAHQMVYTCPEAGAYPKLGTSISQVKEAWPEGKVVRFFANQTPWDDEKPGDHDLTADNWATMINERNASKIHMHGHGLLPLWALENHSNVTSSTVGNLKNQNAYPIITTVSCLTGQFDAKKDPSIAESMIRQPDAGAIAVLAPSREGVPFMLNPRKDFRLMMTEGKMDGTTTAYTQFWESAIQKNVTLGDAFRQVKVEMESNARKDIGFHMVQCELNLLGDPTLDPRPVPPVNFDGAVEVKGDTILISGCKDKHVCIWDGKKTYHLLKADEEGNVSINPGTTEKIFISVFGPGLNTWTTEIN